MGLLASTMHFVSQLSWRFLRSLPLSIILLLVSVNASIFGGQERTKSRTCGTQTADNTAPPFDRP
jgi:hypothetical protein